MTSFVLSKPLRSRCPRCGDRMLAGHRVTTVTEGRLVHYEHAGACPGTVAPAPTEGWPTLPTTTTEGTP